MSIWNPKTAEDRMAWVPIIGCFVPLVIIVLVCAFCIWRLV